MAVLGGLCISFVIYFGISRGNPFLPIALLPGYSPAAYKAAEWCIFYFLFIRPRFGVKAFPAFMASYGSLEIFFNTVYLFMHQGIQFGDFPLTDPQYPLRLDVWFLMLIIGIIFSGIRLRFPISHPNEGSWIDAIRLSFILALFFNEVGSIQIGYGAVTNGNFTLANYWGDLVGNTLWILVIWSIAFPKGQEQTPRQISSLEPRRY